MMTKQILNVIDFKKSFKDFESKKPFSYAVMDNFFRQDIAEKLADEFPTFESDSYNGRYVNQIEIKKSCNIYDRFQETTYSVLNYLNSDNFLKIIKKYTNCKKLYADYGLHGGGQHVYPSGGKLNVHLDYSIHPRLGLQRKFNLLIYLNKNYNESWEGDLGLWSHDKKTNSPKKLVKTIKPVFNRAVIFDTTMNSWHGLEVPNKFPINECRKSLALYYLTVPPKNIENRKRALFVPDETQKNDPEVLALISRRSAITDKDVTKWARE